MSNRKPRPAKSALRDNVETLLWSVVMVFLLRAFVIQAFKIPSESMVPTLLVGDYLFVNKFVYGPKIPFTHVRLPGLRAPRRGDIIVFQYPPQPNMDFIKRCIGTSGQTVEVRHKEVWVDGRPLTEPYAHHDDPREIPFEVAPRDSMPPRTVPRNALFMMGDNRDNSLDSRFWGHVDMDLVKGPAMFTYFSTSGDRWWNAFLHIRFERLFRPIH